MLYHAPRSPDTSVKTVSKTLTDGRSKFGYNRTVVRAPHDEAPTTRILFLNGLFEGRFAFQPLVQRMARRALLQGHGLEVVTYDDPRVGHSAYAQSYRSARADQVARYMATRAQSTITLAGHSRGNHSALDIAPDLRKDALVQSLVSIGGIGFTPKANMSVRQILRLTASEVGTAESRRLSRSAAPTMGRLVCEGAVHTLGGWSSAVAEVQDIFGQNLIEPTVRTSHELPMHVLALTSDKFCPGDETRTNLEQANFDGLRFAGSIQDIATNHAGPLIDPQWTPDLYSIMCVKQESMV